MSFSAPRPRRKDTAVEFDLAINQAGPVGTRWSRLTVNRVGWGGDGGVGVPVAAVRGPFRDGQASRRCYASFLTSCNAPTMSQKTLNICSAMLPRGDNDDDSDLSENRCHFSQVKKGKKKTTTFQQPGGTFCYSQTLATTFVGYLLKVQCVKAS